ncbi:poly(rC)-binding protein 3-like [Daktulosphaira vitifoliae]|uniref:poly(rC)-binding protein 3-like n=1 Tax=Daktulosphaira vitifoliae TaxID=58002 RepID=UPI0021A9B45B|nr:poly(rC)-binding protein 3-like [Daktulosphaira vitifoliae]
MAARDGQDYESTDGHFSDVVLTIRMLMGKEILPLIGEYGEIVRDLRNQSGASISITDSSTPERIVTVTGNIIIIQKAFKLISSILEQNCLVHPQNNRKVPNNTTLIKLIVPASQCGSLIGKGGVKIREIREASGAMVNVASDLLPNSTERTVSISGTAEAITEAIHQICVVMLETPGRGPTVAYRPIATQPGPVVLCGGQAYTLQGSLAIPAVGDQSATTSALNTIASIAPNLIAGSGLDPSVLAALAGSQLRGGCGVSSKNTQQHITHEMAIPNDIIGCIIGKGGTKIAEIRRISGAMIRISNTEEHEASGKMERAITISGQTDAVNVAKTLINLSVDQYNKSSGGEAPDYDEECPTNNTTDMKSTSETLASLLTNPNGISALGALTGLKELLGNINSKKQLSKKREKTDNKFTPY